LLSNGKIFPKQMLKINRDKYILVLCSIFLLWSILLAIEPHNRADWALENVLVLLFVLGLGLTYKKYPLSKLSYTLIFIFLMLHEIGSHYTYSQVPYDEWSTKLFGQSINSMLGLERNHYDRLIHFAYGLLLSYPIREIFILKSQVTGFWSYFFPLDLTMSTSLLYELIEWGAATIFAGELGMAYLGTQGDIWDAHKDMALASLGALITMLLLALKVNLRVKQA